MNTKLRYKSFSALVDGKGRYQKFEIGLGEDVAEAIYDIVEFLQKNEIKGEFVLKINGKRILVSKDANATDLVNEYFGKTEALV